MKNYERVNTGRRHYASYPYAARGAMVAIVTSAVFASIVLCSLRWPDVAIRAYAGLGFVSFAVAFVKIPWARPYRIGVGALCLSMLFLAIKAFTI